MDIEKTRRKIKRSRIIEITALTVAIIALGATFFIIVQSIVQDTNRRRQLGVQIESVTLLDVNGDTIILDENGKYTHFYKK
jgi:hypothetical protein